MRLELEAFGDVQFSRELLRVGANAGDMRPAFDNVHVLLLAVENRQFGSEGGAFSGGWKPLAASTVRYKAKHGLDPRILHATGDLRRSFANNHAKGHVYRASANEMFVGSSIPYARFHQTGTKRMPRRRPFELNEQVRRQVVKILQEHLAGTGRL